MSAKRCVIDECTPPSERRPKRWRRLFLCLATLKMSLMTGVAPSSPSATALSMREMSIERDAAGAEVEVTDLAVPHLPLRQSHVGPARADHRTRPLA